MTLSLFSASGWGWQAVEVSGDTCRCK